MRDRSRLYARLITKYMMTLRMTLQHGGSAHKSAMQRSQQDSESGQHEFLQLSTQLVQRRSPSCRKAPRRWTALRERPGSGRWRRSSGRTTRAGACGWSRGTPAACAATRRVRLPPG